MQPRRHPLRRGLDLRHILGLLLGLATLAAIALPLWFSQASVTLDGAARLLVQDLRSAQNLAVVTARDTMVSFDRSGYRVTDGAGEGVINPRTGQPFTRHWPRDAVFRGVELVAIELEGGAHSVTFDRTGYVRPGGRVHLGFRGAERTVAIESPRGLLSIPGLDEHDDGR